MEPVRLASRPSHEQRCPLCHDLLEGEAPLACPECGTRHHQACLAELGHCATYGCGAEPPAELGSRRPREVYRRLVRERIQRRGRGYREGSQSPGASDPDPDVRALLQRATQEVPLQNPLARFLERLRPTDPLTVMLLVLGLAAGFLLLLQLLG